MARLGTGQERSLCLVITQYIQVSYVRYETCLDDQTVLETPSVLAASLYESRALDQRWPDDVNQGKKPSKFHWDCTICRSCLFDHVWFHRPETAGKRSQMDGIRVVSRRMSAALYVDESTSSEAE